jgi:hypothetical protein
VALEAVLHLVRAIRDPSVEPPLAGVVPILQRDLEH